MVEMIIFFSRRDTVGMPTSEKYASLDEERLAEEFINALSVEMRRDTTQIYPGSLFGFENYFSKHGMLALDSILVSSRYSYSIFIFSSFLTRTLSIFL